MGNNVFNRNNWGGVFISMRLLEVMMSAKITNSYVTDSDRREENDEKEVDLEYKHQPAKDGYGSVEDRGLEIQIERPVDDVEDLDDEEHLDSQFREEYMKENEHEN